MHDEANTATSCLRLSVAMCTYNGSRYLREQLATISSQTRLPDEVVVCDDGSCDNTLDLLHAFAISAPFPVQVIQNEANLGYSRNFRQALDRCTGDVLILSDQDDRWHDTRLQRMEEIFLHDPNAFGIFTDGSLMDQESRPFPGSLWSSFGFDLRDQKRMEQGEAVPVLLQRNVVTGMALAIRQNARDYLRSMPEHWPHDAWLALMLAANGHLRACPEKLVTYRLHAQQQIGVPLTRHQKLAFVRTEGIRAYLQLSRERNIREYTREATQYEALLHVAESDATLKEAWWLPKARAKAEHARKGIERLRLRTFSRVFQVLQYRKEYKCYSPTGLAAFWRDLLL